MNLEKFYLLILAPATALVSVLFVIYSLLTMLLDGYVAWYEPNFFILYSEILLSSLGFCFLCALLGEYLSKKKLF